MRWVFRVARPFLPDGDDPFASGLGGTEQAIIALSAALAEAGEAVSIQGGSATRRRFAGVDWHPEEARADGVQIAINDARLLPRRAGRPVVWFHNEVELLKELRRGRGPALLRHRPSAVFIGTEQGRGASRLFPFRARCVIPYGLSARVLAALPAGAPPPQSALFTSQAYRGLAGVLGWWQGIVAPAAPSATFEALIAERDLPAYRTLCTAPGVSVAARIGNAAVLDRLRRTRVLIAPGHICETFCLAAAEAIAMGVPVVTRGTGALKERVRDGVTGYVCRTDAEMAARTLDLLRDDALWARMHKAGLAVRAGQSWADRAQAWREAVAHA